MRACRPRPSPTRGKPRSRRPRIPRACLISITSPPPTAAGSTSSPARRLSSPPTWPPTARRCVPTEAIFRRARADEQAGSQRARAGALMARLGGAGGGARAAVWALLEAGASEVMVWNRTPARAQALARELGARAVPEAEPADLLVNCTPVGMAPSEPRTAHASGALEPSASEPRELNQLGLSVDQVGEYRYVVDLVYRRGSTQLLAAARKQGARTLDGLEILVAQGALSFQLWTGRSAPLDVMHRAARADGPGG